MLARIVKVISLLGDAFLAVLSIILLVIAVFAWIKPPDPHISPTPVAEHHQYSVAVVFLLLTSVCILGLAVLGITSILVSSSFFLSLYILVLLAQISSQVVLFAFALANRDKIHENILSQWKERLGDGFAGCVVDSADSGCKSPLVAQMEAERFIFIVLLIFLTYQVVMLCLSCYYCEVLTKRERCEAIERDNNEDG